MHVALPQTSYSSNPEHFQTLVLDTLSYHVMVALACWCPQLRSLTGAAHVRHVPLASAFIHILSVCTQPSTQVRRTI
jgi:hypothetical protein